MKTLHSLKSEAERPSLFTYPFCYEPHPLCVEASKKVRRYVMSHNELFSDAQNGKMFGVLVVTSADSQELFFLAAYSGLLAGRNDWAYFVPPVYDAQQPDGYFKTQERIISQTSAISPQTSKELSQNLQDWLFHQYQLLNARGEVKDLVDIVEGISVEDRIAGKEDRAVERTEKSLSAKDVSAKRQ